MRKTILLLAIFLGICIIGCKKDNDPHNVFTNDKHHTDTSHVPTDTTHHVDTIPVGTGCDTSNLTYTNTISGIIQRNCLSCHSPDGNGDDDDDDDDDDHDKQMDSGEDPHMTTYSELLNAIASVGNTKFIRMINHTSEPMPPSYMMTECERRQLEVWIARGKPE